MKFLLAKSSGAVPPAPPHAAERLPGHTAMVVSAAEKILQHRAAASLRAAGLPAAWEGRLNRIVRLAALCHDLGKCSDHFQAMVRHTRVPPQLVRHEALSLWLLWPGKPLAIWARRGVDSDEDYLLALLAAAGHHRKFASRALAEADSGAGSTITLLVAHRDFGETLRQARLGPPPELQNVVLDDSRRLPLRNQLDTWEREIQPLRMNDHTLRMLAVAKAVVLAADVAGSALPKSRERPRWIDEQLVDRPEDDARAVLSGLVSTRLQGGTLRPFQRAVAESSAPVTFVRAGCGSGKTLAAYQWAADRHPTRQLWVTYPTTGTATEGFRGYLQKPEGIVARLEHGRAEVDVDIFSIEGEEHGAREIDRLDAIRNWGADVVACTVDTVLGLIQCQRRGMYAWPGLSHAAVVFDEIHAYDEQLFAALLRFLEALPGLPVLLMTASLPDSRLAALQALCRRVHGVSLSLVDGPTDLERLERYRVEFAEDPWPDVAACLDGNGKVLWVSNTVNRCMAVADTASIEHQILVYHSRFKYVDRVQRHKDVVAAFAGEHSVIASTTQVAEMSLDLSADLLVTDLAPIPALIQRLGRLNRRSTPDNPQPIRKCLVRSPPDPRPYDRAQLDEARAWLKALEGRDLSQRDLVAAWKQDNTRPPPTPGWSAWIDGAFHTGVQAVREASEGVTVLLRDDAAEVRAGRARVIERALPMPVPPQGVVLEKPVCFIPVAPKDAIIYDENRGGCWRS